MEEKHIHFKDVPSDKNAVYNRVWERINKDEVVRFKSSPVWKYVSIAATVALLIVSSLFYIDSTKPETIENREIVATPGTKARVVLPDNTVVWLNSSANIQYPHKFIEKNRKIAFLGEAFFEVEKDKEKPFIIQTDGLRIQVLGTSFNVHAEPESDVVEITLSEGSVALFKEDNDTDIADHILQPDEQAVFNKVNGQFNIRKVRSEFYSAWVTGEFNFENNSLQEISNALTRAFNTHIYIESEQLKSTHLTARFSHQETLDEILSIIQIPANFKYTKIEGRIYISDK